MHGVMLDRFEIYHDLQDRDDGISLVAEPDEASSTASAFGPIALLAGSATRSITLRDEFWNTVVPMLPLVGRDPDKAYTRRPGGGRKAKPARLIFEGILFVLRERCAWKDLPAARYGSYSVVQQKYMRWSQAGVFDAIWKSGLAHAPEFAGVRWGWQTLGPAMLVPSAVPVPAGHGPAEHGPAAPASVGPGGGDGSNTPGFAWRPILTGGHRVRSSRGVERMADDRVPLRRGSLRISKNEIDGCHAVGALLE